MGFISSFLGKLRKDKTNNLPVEYKLVLDFNKDFSDLLLMTIVRHFSRCSKIAVKSNFSL